MKAEDLEEHVTALGYAVEVIRGQDSLQYTVIRGLQITQGSFAGQTCDVALHRVEVQPYVPAPALHIKPHLLPMNPQAPHATQASGVGTEWQYWSRRYDRVPTPKGIWTHILTVLGEV